MHDMSMYSLFIICSKETDFKHSPMEISTMTVLLQNIINHNPDSENAPFYYTKVLKSSCIIMCAYFVSQILFASIMGYTKEALLILIWLGGSTAAAFANNYLSQKWNLLFYSAIIVSWVIHFTIMYGWNCGGHNFILPLMVIALFYIHFSTAHKIFIIVLLFALRMLLYCYCRMQEPVYPLETVPYVIFQIINTLFFFFNIAYACMLFSTNIQKAEKELRITNQELQKQALTDPLTTLYNRRFMMDILEKQITEHPKDVFAIALGDIDLFKKVNDTLGHNFGDQVLRDLSRLFKEKISDRGYVCRWGGEEFFFYFPNMNIDEAYEIIAGIHTAVGNTIIHYQEYSCSVTMTFGMEEYDYSSSLVDLIKNADDKLYSGKKQGRNRIVF